MAEGAKTIGAALLVLAGLGAAVAGLRAWETRATPSA